MMFTLRLANDWIDDNIEILYKKYKISKNQINLDPSKASASQILIKNMISKQMEEISIPRSVENRVGELIKTNDKQSHLEMVFKLDNKLAFITNDNLKEQFIEKINYDQMVSDISEKEKFREFLKQYCEKMIQQRRRRIHLKHYKEMHKMRTHKNSTYEESSIFIENSIERDIKFFNKMHAVDTSQLMIIKEKVKKVEQQIKINKARML